MRTLILISLFSFFCCEIILGQTIDRICVDIDRFDQGYSPQNYPNNSINELLGLLLFETKLKNDLITRNVLESKLEEINSFKALYMLRDTFENYVYAQSIVNNETVYAEGLSNNLKILDYQINQKLENKLVFYNFTETSNKWVKGFHFYHDNDVFLYNTDLNKDRDYTGGFRIEVFTDLLKIRLLKSFLNSDKVLSYQSLFFGGESYTPYIRINDQTFDELGIDPTFENDFYSEDTQQELSQKLTNLQEATDRPFASFQYFGRAKYRMHYRGWVRSESLIKVGTVGGKLGEKIQQVLHNDLIVGSAKVLNWDRQIGNGGRLAFNFDHTIDFLLYSSKYVSLLRNWKGKNNLNNNNSLNVYVPTEFAFGNVHTYLGGGIGVSNKSFLQTNHLNETQYKRNFSNCKFHAQGNFLNKSFKYVVCGLNHIYQHSYLSAEYKTRRVYHNSTLHGLGYFNRFSADKYDDENRSVYVLSEDDTANWLHSVKLTLNIRFRKASVYYSYNRLLNKEFEVASSVEDNKYATPDKYGYGRFGLIIHM